MRAEIDTTKDMKLRLAVMEKLAGDPRTGQANIRVGVLNGIVHLAGEAPTVETWCLAEILAEEVEGVRAVVNRIETAGAPSPARAIHLRFLKSNNNEQGSKGHHAGCNDEP